MIERSFLYGDLLFETIKVRDGKIRFVDRHYQRLKRSAELLQFDLTPFTQEIFEMELQTSLGNKRDARLRFVMHRDSEGYYTPKVNHVRWNVELLALENTEKVCESLGVFEEFKKPCNALSNIKSGNALIYVMAGLYARQNRFDDCLILNEHGRIAETVSSNIFVIKNNILITPPLSEGCIEGVMRQVVIEEAIYKGIYYDEVPLKPHELILADEVFLTNTIAGIIPVKSFNFKKYATTFSSYLKSFMT